VNTPVSSQKPLAIVVTRGLLESAVSVLWNERHPLGADATMTEAQSIAMDADYATTRLWTLLSGHEPPPMPPPESARTSIFASVRRFFVGDPP
jgi:hypothetical protein